MAEFSFTIPDGEVPRIFTGLCASAGLEINQENARGRAKQWVMDTVLSYERSVKYAEAEAAAQAILDAIPEVEIT